MKLITTLALAALAGLAGLATAVPVAQAPGAPFPGYTYYDRYCRPERGNYDVCDLDTNYMNCNHGKATLYACDGGCVLNCPPDWPGSPCDPPGCPNKRLHPSPRNGLEEGS
ncbi:hypothetical protein IMZ48_13005 [Candidatus Bathyarchaeota archaeon]|nr:hypothetical protein [Candidatus Bathyarchaeota archaeon]